MEERELAFEVLLGAHCPPRVIWRATTHLSRLAHLPLTNEGLR